MVENNLKKQIETEIFNKGYSKSTAQVYSQNISDLAKFYSTDNPLELSSEDISRYIDHLSKIEKKNPNTVNIVYSSSVLYFNKLHRKDYIFDYKKVPRKERAKIVLPTIDDIRKLFEVTANLKSKALMSLVYGCGLEMGELVNLKFEDIDINRNVILLKSNRTKKLRETYISSNVFKLITEYYRAYNPKTWLFESKILGEQCSNKTIQYHIKQSVKKAGLSESINFIVLKYCYVKHSEELGIPLSVILKRLNVSHSDSYTFYTNMEIKDSEKLYISPFDNLENLHEKVVKKTNDFFWETLHPKVKILAQGKFNNGFYADCIETCLKELNSIIKTVVKEKSGKEFDGSDLMGRAFSLKEPIIALADLVTDTGQNIQKGYLQIFSGVMTGIRNPKAHENISIDRKTAIHLLFISSHLFNMIENGSH